jgi:hypothetical protein
LTADNRAINLENLFRRNHATALSASMGGWFAAGAQSLLIRVVLNALRAPWEAVFIRMQTLTKVWVSIVLGFPTATASLEFEALKQGALGA